MARKQKVHTAATVMGVLNIIFGSLGLLGTICGGVAMIGLFAMFSAAKGNMKPGEAEKVNELISLFLDNIPGFVPFLAITYIIGFILALGQLISGIGLLKMNEWARKMSLGIAAVAILVQLGSLGFTIAVLQPGVEKAQQAIMAEARKQNPNAPAVPPQNPLASIGGSVIGSIFGLIYPIATFIVLMNPGVVAAFQGKRKVQGRYEEPEDDEMGHRRDYEDGLDDDYEEDRR